MTHDLRLLLLTENDGSDGEAECDLEEEGEPAVGVERGDEGQETETKDYESCQEACTQDVDVGRAVLLRVL